MVLGGFRSFHVLVTTTSSDEREYFEFPLIPRKIPNIRLRSINPRDFYFHTRAVRQKRKYRIWEQASLSQV